jgi:hypothetical protein
MALTNDGRDYMTGACVVNPAQLFDATNATIGVGTSTTAFNVTQSDLIAAASVKAYGVVDGAPTNSPANQLQFVATFGTAVANFAWNEWGVFNSTGVAPTASETMLSRKVESPSLGTKTTAQSWEITCTLTVSTP